MVLGFAWLAACKTLGIPSKQEAAPARAGMLPGLPRVWKIAASGL